MKPETSIRLAPSGEHFILQTKGEMGVEVPISETGARIIASILRARQMSPRPRIGTPEFPTQHLIEKWKKEDAARQRTEAAARVAETKRGYSLEDLEIDL